MMQQTSRVRIACLYSKEAQPANHIQWKYSQFCFQILTTGRAWPHHHVFPRRHWLQHFVTLSDRARPLLHLLYCKGTWLDHSCLMASRLCEQAEFRLLGQKQQSSISMPWTSLSCCAWWHTRALLRSYLGCTTICKNSSCWASDWMKCCRLSPALCRTLFFAFADRLYSLSPTSSFFLKDARGEMYFMDYPKKAHELPSNFEFRLMLRRRSRYLREQKRANQ